MSCESDDVLFKITNLLNDPEITKQVIRYILAYKYHFSWELIEQIIPKAAAEKK